MSTERARTMRLCLLAVLASSPGGAIAADQQDLFTTRGNSELPNVLYITPWRAPETAHKTQQLTLHSLYGDLFEPIEPQQFTQRVRAYQAAKRPASVVAEHR